MGHQYLYSVFFSNIIFNPLVVKPYDLKNGVKLLELES